ncbi:hypothetical protein [Clostridium sp. YIM B02551]|uniref:hypothetical protein n=1 Tax=Clostridium sp. YIM B02551 TaxID=2910679 RepID=UPI001EEB624C|nr:hypothetical protein [Clostridium sp. YIM B02551]
MKIYRVLVDKLPKECLLCPLKTNGIKIENLQCGKINTQTSEEWTVGSFVPDNRCRLEEM